MYGSHLRFQKHMVLDNYSSKDGSPSEVPQMWGYFNACCHKDQRTHWRCDLYDSERMN